MRKFSEMISKIKYDMNSVEHPKQSQVNNSILSNRGEFEHFTLPTYNNNKSMMTPQKPLSNFP